MFARHLTPHILKYAKQYPIVALVGPRQSGKTTLAKALFPTYKYLSLENLNLRKSTSDDPEGFLAHIFSQVCCSMSSCASSLIVFNRTSVSILQSCNSRLTVSSLSG